MKRSLLFTCLALALVACGFNSRAADQPPRIAAPEVAALLDQGMDVLFLDTRTDRDWSRSEVKITGAERVRSSAEITRIIDTTAKDRPIVTYCA